MSCGTSPPLILHRPAARPLRFDFRSKVLHLRHQRRTLLARRFSPRVQVLQRGAVFGAIDGTSAVTSVLSPLSSLLALLASIGHDGPPSLSRHCRSRREALVALTCTAKTRRSYRG